MRIRMDGGYGRRMKSERQILEFERCVESLIKREILIGQIAGRDLRNQVIAIWRGGVVSGY